MLLMMLLMLLLMLLLLSLLQLLQLLLLLLLLLLQHIMTSSMPSACPSSLTFCACRNTISDAAHLPRTICKNCT